MKVGIIGFGVVGKAIYNTLNQYYEIVKYDKFIELDTFTKLKNCKYIFIAVPTPYNSKLNCLDDSAIIESLDSLRSINFDGLLIIKSTLGIGLTETYLRKYDFKLAYNPEFLRERISPDEDFKNQKEIIIGTDDDVVFEGIRFMYIQAFPEANFVKVTPGEAEMIKLAQNITLGSRVTIANIVFDACEKRGIDYKVIRQLAFDNQPLIGPFMVDVPGPDGKRGFGGKCLPKDLEIFNAYHDNEILAEIIKYNKSIRQDL